MFALCLNLLSARIFFPEHDEKYYYHRKLTDMTKHKLLSRQVAKQMDKVTSCKAIKAEFIKYIGCLTSCFLHMLGYTTSISRQTWGQIFILGTYVMKISVLHLSEFG